MYKNDIKISVKNRKKKELELLIQTKKGQREITEGILLPNPQSIRTIGEKELGNIGSRYNQTNSDKGKRKKIASQKNKKISQN